MLMASILASSRLASALRADHGAPCSRFKQASQAVSDPAGSSTEREGRERCGLLQTCDVLKPKVDGWLQERPWIRSFRIQFDLCVRRLSRNLIVVGGRPPPPSPTSKSRLCHNGTSRPAPSASPPIFTFYPAVPLHSCRKTLLTPSKTNLPTAPVSLGPLCSPP